MKKGIWGWVQVSTVDSEKKRQNKWFHQENPHYICQNQYPKRQGKCRNPRCSLACRSHYARKKSAILMWQLNRISSTHFIYFGNLDVHEVLTDDEHREIRSEFSENLRKFKKKRNCETKFYAMSEIGDDLTVHYHYVLYSDIEISQDNVKSMWSAACDGRKTTVQHLPPQKGIEPAAKYMFKDTSGVRNRKTHIWLFKHGSIQIPWKSRGFFEIPQEEIWNLLRKQWFGEDYQETCEKPPERASNELVLIYPTHNIRFPQSRLLPFIL